MKPTIAAFALSAFGGLTFAGLAQATILTFDIAGGITNFQAVPEEYGDSVGASPQAGHSYGVGGEGFTPNAVVDYGAPGELPALWNTGYGDLAGVHFNDQDGDSTFTVLFTADAGFLVSLLDFDIASFSSGGQTLAGLSVRDVGSDSVLFALGPTIVTGATHLQVAPNATARQLELLIDLTGLGSFSDNIGIDNVRFGQLVDPDPPSPGIPEPATLGLLGTGLLGLGLARHAGRRKAGRAAR